MTIMFWATRVAAAGGVMAGPMEMYGFSNTNVVGFPPTQIIRLFMFRYMSLEVNTRGAAFSGSIAIHVGWILI